jgi:signal peptidase II
MKINKWARAAIILFILALNIGCDQVSKVIVRKDLTTEINYFGGFFTLVKMENTGAFLSLGDSLGGPLHFILLVLLPVLAILAALVYLFYKTDLNKYTVFAIILITGGGAGNLYDRVKYGSVTDFMHIGMSTGFLQTGVFNVADMSIMAGMFIILIRSFLNREKEEPKTEHTSDQE